MPVEEPIQKYAVIGSNFTISCETETNVPFKWRKDNVNITESNNRLGFFLSSSYKNSHQQLKILTNVFVFEMTDSI